MIIEVKLNENVSVKVEFEDFSELQDLIVDPDFTRMMKNQLGLVSYLEMNDPVFMTHVFDFIRDDDYDKFKDAVTTYTVGIENFVGYFAYAFDVPKSYISVR